MNKAVRHRVLMLLENSGYPSDPRVSKEATALAQAGYSVTVICPARPRQCWCESVDGVVVYRFPAPREGNGLLGYVWEYGYSVAAMSVLSVVVFFRTGFDIIHAHNPPDALCLIGAFYKLLGKRFVFDHHDLAPEMYDARFRKGGRRFVRRVLLFLEKLSCRLADHVITTNESYKAVEMQRSQVPKDRVTVVRNGPDLSVFRPLPKTSERGASGKKTIVYVGAMSVQDGVDFLLRAMQYLVCDFGRTDIFCVLVGDGSDWDNLQSLAARLEISDYVLFTGMVEPDEVPGYLSAAILGVAPEPANRYNDRSTMIKVMEYMAMGKPVVAFDLPETRVTAGTAASYARPNDERDFAWKIIELLNAPDRREEMGRLGRQRVEAELAWPYQAARLLDAYRQLGTVPSLIPSDQSLAGR